MALKKEQIKQIESELITLARQMLAVVKQYPEGKVSVYIDPEDGYISFFDAGRYSYTEWEDKDEALFAWDGEEIEEGEKL